MGLLPVATPESPIPASGRRVRLRYAIELVTYGVGAAALLALLTVLSDRISANSGYGWDGAQYVRMLDEGLEGGTPSTRLRPLVVFINAAVNRHVFRSPVATFHAMNLVFACVLALLLADLCRRYGATKAARATLVLNVFLCISTAKMFAFYPTLVDLGAYAFITAGAWAIVTGRRLLIVLTGVLAVLSREFAGVLVLFGVARDVRQGRSLPIIAATYVPVMVAIVWVRQVAASFPDNASELRVLSFSGLVTALVSNVSSWANPLYVVFWLYFAATVFGGLSLWLLTTASPWKACLGREPEWFALIVPVVAVTAVGYIDMWRYMAYALPALPALWAWSVSGVARDRVNRLFVAVSAATLVTQRPWQQMDVESYFRDWFPYYLVAEDPVTAWPELFPVWGYRLAIGVASCAALVALGRLGALVPSPPRRGA